MNTRVVLTVDGRRQMQTFGSDDLSEPKGPYITASVQQRVYFRLEEPAVKKQAILSRRSAQERRVAALLFVCVCLPRVYG
ncbi:MAG: hypothetical protein GY850_27395 [bacterium]|nr:hypothetical protein [bacterium]